MKCDLCPRKCLVDRKKGEKGICGQTENLKVARAALHFWEEPCISGDAGSGAVFFSGDRKSTRLNSSHTDSSRMPSSA